jgi:hypothetical protein
MAHIGITGASNTAKEPNSWAYQLKAAMAVVHEVEIQAAVGHGPLRQRALLAQLASPLDMLIVSPSGNGIQDGPDAYMRYLLKYMRAARLRTDTIYCLTISPRTDPTLNEHARVISGRIAEDYEHPIDIFGPMSADPPKYTHSDPQNHWRKAGQDLVLRCVLNATRL